MRSEVFNRNFLALVLLCLLPSLALHGQSGIVGTVLNGSDKRPLEGVEVILLPDVGSSFTDRRGEFHLTNLPAGTYTLVFFSSGYGTVQKEVVVTKDRERRLEIALHPLTEELEAVTITDEGEQLYALTRLRAVEGMAIYAGRKSEVVLLDQMVANLATNNARQIFGQVSGLNIYEADDGGLQLNIGGRGLDPNRSASFNTRQNGYDISADVLGYPESYYTPPAEALASIQVVRGAASLQYGTQFGGLVNFLFKQPHPTQRISVDSRQTVGSNGLFNSFNGFSGTIGRWSYYTYYQYKRGDGFRPNSGFASHNAFAHLGYQLSDQTKLQLEVTYLSYLAQQAGGLTDAQFYRDPYTSNRARNWFAVDWRLLALRLEHRFSERTRLSLQLFGLDATREAVGFRTNRVSQIDEPGEPRDLLIGNFRNGGAEARLLHHYALGARNAILLVGAKYYQADNESIQGPGTADSSACFQLAVEQFPDYPFQSEFRFPNQNLAFFTENIVYLTDKLSLTPGLRFEYIHTRSEGSYRRINFDLAGNPILNESFTDNRDLPRSRLLLGTGLSYRSGPGLEVYANISRNYRSVTFNDIRVVNPSFQVDPNIADERGYTADAGVRGRTERVTFDGSLFLLRYNNRLGEVLQAETRIDAEGQVVETGRIVRLRTNIGEAVLYGLESLIDGRIWRREDSARGDAYLHAFANLALTRSRYLSSEQAGVEGKQVEFVPLANLKVGLRGGWGPLQGSLQWTYLSEQFTDATNAPQDKRDNQSGIIGGIPSYDIVDLGLSYRRRRLRLEGGINNLLNRQYFTRRATGYPGPGIIPSAPRTFYLSVGLQL